VAALIADHLSVLGTFLLGTLVEGFSLFVLVDKAL
jgi:hypothetical protein